MSLLSRLNRTLGVAPAPAPAEAPAPDEGAPEETDDERGPRLAAALNRHGDALLRRESRRQDGAPDAARPEAAAQHSAFAGDPLDFGAALPTARRIDTPHGGVWSVRTDVPLATHHGHTALDSLDGMDFADLAVVTADERLSGFDARRALYVDLETTGLEHGGGNVAFIIAAGWFEDHVFRVEQLILREHDEEHAMLALIWQWLHAHPFLVSFNGKSFDLSILQNRLVLHRFSSEDRAAVKLRPHLDLLHVSRAFFKGAWPDTRLQTIEREALGFMRDDDMPGALAPSCFFTWLRYGNARPLQHITRHNRDDVLTMVALTTLLGSLAAPGGVVLTRPAVALNLARRLVRVGDPTRALMYLEPLALAGDPSDSREIAELGLTAARRLDRLDDAGRWAARLLTHDDAHGGALRMLKRIARRG